MKTSVKPLTQAIKDAVRQGTSDMRVRSEIRRAYEDLKEYYGYPIKVYSNAHARALIVWLSGEWRKHGKLVSIKDLSQLDVKALRDISELFHGARDMSNEFFVGIEHWDVSNVVYAIRTFEGCEYFNQPIGDWRLSRVRFMNGFFKDCKSFDQPLSWDVRKLFDMSEFLLGCESFNNKLFSWGGPKSAVNLYAFFKGCSSFNQPLRHWFLRNVVDISEMFNGCINFTQDISCWRLQMLCNFHNAFASCPAKKPRVLEGIYETHDHSAKYPAMFYPKPKNRSELIESLQNLALLFMRGDKIDLSVIDVSDVEDFSKLFIDAGLSKIDSDFFAGIEHWDVSAGADFRKMFAYCKNFNQPLNGWNMQNAKKLDEMFKGCGISDENLPKQRA